MYMQEGQEAAQRWAEAIEECYKSQFFPEWLRKMMGTCEHCLKIKGVDYPLIHVKGKYFDGLQD